MHLRSLASTTHTHNLNQQAKLGLWTQNQRLFLRLPAFRSLLSSFLAPIHKYLADIGLAPKLYGYAEVDSAPIAYVMEYLDPSTWQTLYQFDSTKAKVQDPKLQTALNTITKTLESKKMFTGIFEGQACHPAERNTDIQWPGEAGEPVKKGHDSEMVDS